MAHKPHHSRHKPRKHSTRHRSAKQIAATKKWNAAGRRAARLKKRSAKQLAAARHNLIRARAAKKALHHGHVTASQRAGSPLYASSAYMDYLPICTVVAFAESIYYQSGIVIPDADILAIHSDTGITSIAELAEYSMANGFAGYRLESCYQCDEEQLLSGLVYGLVVPTGYHVGLAMDGGLLSWGTVYPWTVRPSEAWLLLWAVA